MEVSLAKTKLTNYLDQLNKFYNHFKESKIQLIHQVLSSTTSYNK
jgi:hypothetical protein